MFQKGKKQSKNGKRDMLYEKIVETLDCTESFAKQVVAKVNLEVVEEILAAKKQKLETDFVNCERDIEKQVSALQANKKYIEANDNLKLLRTSHNETVKPFKLANKLRLKVLEEFI